MHTFGNPSNAITLLMCLKPCALDEAPRRTCRFIWCTQPAPVALPPASQKHPAPSRLACLAGHDYVANETVNISIARLVFHCVPGATDRQPSCFFHSPAQPYPSDTAATAFQYMATATVSLALVVVAIAAFAPPPITGRLGLAVGVMLAGFSLFEMIAFSLIVSFVTARKSRFFASTFLF